MIVYSEFDTAPSYCTSCLRSVKRLFTHTLLCGQWCL